MIGLYNEISSETKSSEKPIKTVIKANKKKNRYFETYISKVLKQISQNNGITCNAKQQLNSAVCIIAKEISRLVMKLTEFANKKTISDKEVINAIKIIFSGDLALNSIREGEKSIKTYNTELLKCGGSRQGKAGIIFPPSITEKFLRNFGYSKVMVTSSAPIFFASVLEYFVAEILILATKSASDNNRIRITIRDLQLSVYNDIEMTSLFNKLNLSFLGGGVIPFIHSCLLTKKVVKYKKKDNNDSKKPHRFRPGTVAIREIKKYQKMSDCLIFAKFPFERLVRSIYTNCSKKFGSNSIKISKDVFIVLQYYIEQYIVSILKDSNTAAIHANRVKLMLIDIEFVCKLKGINIKPDCVYPMYPIQEDI